MILFGDVSFKTDIKISERLMTSFLIFRCLFIHVAVGFWILDADAFFLIPEVHFFLIPDVGKFFVFIPYVDVFLRYRTGSVKTAYLRAVSSLPGKTENKKEFVQF